MVSREIGVTGVDASSRYFNHRVIELDGIATLETWNPPFIPESNDDVMYAIQPGEAGRLDIIAAKFYDEQRLWWVLAFVNDIRDQFRQVRVGDTIRVPSVDTIRRRVLLR